METAIAVLIILTVVLFGALTIVQVYLSSQDVILESWREMEERRGERSRTQISPVGAETINETKVEVILENTGDTKLADFDQWDVIVQYDSLTEGNVVEWLSYNYIEKGGVSSGEWSNDKGEDIGDIFEPGIFNPREVMTITLVVASSIGQPSTNLATIATPNGISASAVFTR